MKRTLTVLGIFFGMAVLGFVMPHMPGEYLSAAEDCGNNCGSGDGDCVTQQEPMGFFDCCGGHCRNYPGDNPVFWCTGRCSISNGLCDCTQVGCHSFPCP
ncbi:MAG: hypothetical protein OEV49_03605 [candidate division Zixibacteria bacterium]|nr:hypothetical protein [candidate division Zixibacteria bacterium]MDH3937827.1 hypothetical protein [candidate division Zixibacteria bacterium]